MRRGMPVEEATRREILRKQMELLAEYSKHNPLGCELPEGSREMTRIYRELSKPFLIILSAALFYLGLGFLVCIKKLRRAH